MRAGILEPRSGRSPSIEKLNNLTGIDQELVYEENIYTGTFVENNENKFLGVSSNDSFGQLERPVISNFGELFSRETPQNPEKISLPYRIIIKDKDALSLGRFSNSDEICWAIKKTNGFTSIVYNSPILPARLLRKMASIANAHIYIDDDDCLWAADGLLVHHACSGGVKKIKFPKKQDMFDLRSNIKIGSNTDELILDVKTGQTPVIADSEVYK